MDRRPTRHLARGLILIAALTTGLSAADRPQLRMAVVEGIEFIADHDIPRERLTELAACVTGVQERLADELGLPPVENMLRIFLFDDRRAFSLYVRQMIPAVNWTETMGRHGIFLQREGQSYVFLLVSDELDQSLRHETVHVVLNAAVPDAPIWLDEGLAQCYEAEDGTHYSGRAASILHNDWLRREPPSLESLVQNTSMREMSPRDYAGAWHHVSRCLHDDAARDQLRSALAALQRGEQVDIAGVLLP